MSRALIFHPEHRLKQLLTRSGGVTAEEAVARAQARLDAVKARCVAGLDDKIDALAEAFTPHAAMRRDTLVAQASEIFTIAALFEEADVARAAACLCDLLMFAHESETGPGAVLSPTWTTPLYLEAVGVHVDALRRLRRPERGGEGERRDEIAAGLLQVVHKFVGPEHVRADELCTPRAPVREARA